MSALDIVTLNAFYHRDLGRVAARMIDRRLRAAWPDAAGADVLGLGYAAPFLERFRGDARRVCAAMPAAQGVQPWPSRESCCAALVEGERLPYPDALFDRVLIVHYLEEVEGLTAALREAWRVCAPEARVIAVVANRRGLWSRLETSPFGHGRSFTQAQLRGALDRAMFEPVAWSRALYAPPWDWRPAVRAADTWERLGERVAARLGAVILVEAVKRVFAAPARRAPARAFAPVPAFGAATARAAARDRIEG